MVYEYYGDAKREAREQSVEYGYACIVQNTNGEYIVLSNPNVSWVAEFIDGEEQ